MIVDSMNEVYQFLKWLQREFKITTIGYGKQRFLSM